MDPSLHDPNSIPTLNSVVELQANTEDFPKEMKFKSPPDMLELCIVDSMMPSPRFMQRMTHDQSLAPPPSSIQFEDEMLLQAGSTSSIAKLPPLLQTDNETSTSPCVAKKVPEKLINSLQGAWKSPLKTSNPEIPILRYNTRSLLSDLDSQWPSLANGTQTCNRRSSQALPKSTHPRVEKESLASFDLDNGLESDTLLYSTKGISWIGSGLGAPMLTSRPWLDPTQLGEAKILVEVKLDKPFPPKVAIEDESGSITMVDVFYSWLPPKCVKCGQLGHKATRCLGKLSSKQDDQPSIPHDRNNVILAKTSTPLISEDTPSSAPVRPSAQNIKSSGIKNVSTEAGPIMTEIASQCDGITISGDLSPPASPNALSTPRDNTSTLEATTVVTNAEDGSSVCRSLDTEAFQGNEDYVDDDIMRTQSGRTVKPSQKLQEMEWSTAKGKRGRKGRGGKYG